MKPELTKSERKVFLLCCKGLSNQEIALALGISPNTVKSHLRAIFKKKAVKSRTTLILKAIAEQQKEKNFFIEDQE